ncbi:MAG: hypothetical protein ACRC1J_11940 [Sandaracinobacteroides sp.]
MRSLSLVAALRPDARAAAIRVADIAYELAAVRDVDGGVPDTEIAALADTGLLHAPLPPALGGISLGMGPDTALLLRDVLRTIGGGSLAIGRLFEGHVNAAKLVSCYGTDLQLQRIAGEADAGRLSAVWNAQTGDGLRFDGRTLSGGKIYCSGIGLVDRPLLTAATESGLQMLMPDVGGAASNLSAWTPLGMRASLTGTGDFTGIAVRADECIGTADDYYRAPLFAGGAWRVLAVQLGALERLTCLYRMQMRIHGRTNDPVQRARFGETAALLETARLWVSRSASVAEDPAQDAEEASALVNLARKAFEHAALALIERVQRGIGLGSMLRPNPVERICRDLSTYLRQPFPDAALDAAATWALEDRPMHRAIGD